MYSLVQTNSRSVYRFDSLDTLVSFWAHNILHMTDKFATMYAMEYPSITRGLIYLDPFHFENGSCHNISKKGRVSDRFLKIFCKCSSRPFSPGSLHSGWRPHYDVWKGCLLTFHNQKICPMTLIAASFHWTVPEDTCQDGSLAVQRCSFLRPRLLSETPPCLLLRSWLRLPWPSPRCPRCVGCP